MATKTIPFDLEMAKKVLSGEIKGKVYEDCKRYRMVVDRILCTDAIGDYPIIYTKLNPNRDIESPYVAKYSNMRIELEVPDEPKRPRFKPFDRVLVREGGGSGYLSRVWVPAIFQEESPISDEPYLASGMFWKKCIPYEGNEHLIGTAYNPKED